jgi:hypothetical protein
VPEWCPKNPMMKALLPVVILTAGLACAQMVPTASPAPALTDGKVFTLAEINRRKFELNGKVVRVELVGRRYDVEEMSPTEFRIFVRDPSRSLSGYGHIYFSREGLETLGLLKKPNYGVLSFFVLVSPEKLTAIGRYAASGNGTIQAYHW